jgi:hypothetical protein
MTAASPPPAARPPRGVAVSTLILSALLVAAVTAAAFLAFLHFTAAGQAVGQALNLNPAEEPLTQKEAVRPGGESTGVVYYPVPFASPPHVTLTCGKREYVVTQQDEAGFTWAAKDLADDFFDLPANAVAGKTLQRRPDVRYEDFTWEARGMRARADRTPLRTFEQKGTLQTSAGGEGEVYFPTPYASPPNVELPQAGLEKVIVTRCTRAGFRWKNTADKDDRLAAGAVTWTARGVKAAREDLAAPAAEEPDVVEQKGWFSAVGMQQGEVFFAVPFAAPPNVQLKRYEYGDDSAEANTVVADCTPTGFKWKNTGKYNGTLVWTARGLRATQPAAKPAKE